MAKYFDGMGNDVTAYVNGLADQNEKLKQENLKLKHDAEVKAEPKKKKEPE